MIRKLLPSALFILIPMVLFAQETYSVSATAAQVAKVDKGRILNNRLTCLKLGLAVGCTQASACVAAGAAGGSGCTAAQARAAEARIYPNTSAGREEYLGFGIILDALTKVDQLTSKFDAQDYCTWFNAQNQATKDAECSKISAPAGCLICQ